MAKIVRALWPSTIAVLCFTAFSDAACDRLTSATRAFAPQMNVAMPLGSIGKSPVRKRRLRETAPQVRVKPSCPITAQSHYLFC
jgi:hypothetical protein